MPSDKPLERTIYVGPFVHSKTFDELELCEDGAIGVDEKGKITFVDRHGTGVSNRPGWESAKVVRISGKGFFFPGFIGPDSHIHASQYPNLGIFGKSTLLDWLQTYTFPLEGSFSDLEKARKIYNRVVARTLANGTTTAAYYATIHVPATNLLADICQTRGQRAFVGRVCMNSTLSPDYYRDESAEQAIKASRECIEHVKKIDPANELISHIITPRFAPSCTKESLKMLGDLHRETGVPCQTHISENKNECELVKELYPESKSYAGVYDDAGLLTDKMILAHAVHLTQEEKELIRDRKSKISHCPASNTAITSGCCRVRELMDTGIDVGLGTDVSGGFSPSILEVTRQAIWVSRHIAMHEGDHVKLSTEEALYLATRGGAKVVGLEDKIGGFDVGKEFDAQMVRLDEVQDGDDELDDEDGPVDIFGNESFENTVAKWVYNGNHQNTVAVWVKGRLVHQTKKFAA
ncbi:guanine deaminase [Rhizodiscina lignyota]|uniref:Guanine deaminase n=1 Tax=Rhizodiscina lignyota TaxID=1504668 RepID=A0A9P4M9C2_9PEZI|nr:guanine deaminase [Rhizodiscina lignyota]